MPVRYRFPLKRSPKSDPQQYRVYRMENESIGARNYARLTKERIRSLARSVCRNYCVPQVTFKWCDLGKWAAEWDNGLIKLNNRKGSSSDLITLTHELAHHIHWFRGGDVSEEHEPHGPEFMACHMSVLDTCRVIPVPAMRAVCEMYKVRFIDPGTRASLSRLTRIARGRHSPQH